MINKTKIEWCTHTWNPVTGCRHGCPYCYARKRNLPVFYKDSLRELFPDLPPSEFPW